MRTEARREPVLTGTDAAQPAEAASGVAVSTPAAPRAVIEPAVVTMRLLAVALLGIAGLSWDLWTKHAVFAAVGEHGIHPVWRGNILGVSIRFQLATTFNRGALWGMGQGQSLMFASLSVIALGAIAYFLWNRQAVASRWLTTITGLLLAGTLGNLFDRLGLHGFKTPEGRPDYAVRDFLDFWFFDDRFQWATFNFADCYLVVGAAMLVLHSLWMTDPEPVPAAPAKAAA